MRIKNSTLKKQRFLLSKPIAHRGLWGIFNGKTFIENSIPAYQNAVDYGFPIEIDVFSSTDGVLFCFHDDNLKRMTGKDANIFDCDSTTIKNLRLFDSDCSIPTLKQVLSLCQNKVPLLIEIKKQPKKNIVDLVQNELADYKGEYAIQSFNPLYLLKVKKKAPFVLRGVLGTDYEESESKFTNFIISKMPLNFLIKPDFISYNYKALDCANKNAKCPVLAWTVTNSKIYDGVKNKCDNIIFEGFLPNE